MIGRAPLCGRACGQDGQAIAIKAPHFDDSRLTVEGTCSHFERVSMRTPPIVS